MAYADVAALVSLLSNGQADTTLLPLFYNDVMNQLGPQDWHTNAVPVTFAENTSTVNLPSTLLDLLQLVYDDTVLSELSYRELEALNPGWRNVKGTPRAYTTEAETVKTVEVFPVPTQTSPPIIPVHGQPTGQDYAPGNGIVFMAEYRTAELPYITLPFALKVLAREYVRESDHQDVAYATLCDNFATMLLEMLRK